jgi:ParB-like chromosome segregation protein Spo0J
MKNTIQQLINEIIALDLDSKVQAINQIKIELHKISPFNTEPVDCVLWVKNDSVHANDYNPNSVAPPEMELLRLSIEADGYTQPIVSMLEDNGTREVIDGFHRNRVGKECADIQKRVNGYLPVVTINETRENKADRIASTIRHNRARGKHKVTAMSDIVVDLKKRNWSDEKIARELGMDADEVLRLCQISGIAEMFNDSEFSQAWEINSVNDLDNLEDENDTIQP